MYAFYPDYDIGRKNSLLIESVGAFSKKECEDIIKLCDSLEIENGTLFDSDDVEQNGRGVLDDYRKSKVAWLKHNEESNWIYDKMTYITKKINSMYFNYDLFGFLEPMQYSIYDDSDKGHYNWHVDRASVEINAPASFRKLSISVQLSDPSEYDGGELTITESMNNTNDKIVNKDLGVVVHFPSYVLHQVAPVTRGTRKSLVAWVAGPPFR